MVRGVYRYAASSHKAHPSITVVDAAARVTAELAAAQESS
jgi:hypothetical protein